MQSKKDYMLAEFLNQRLQIASGEGLADSRKVEHRIGDDQIHGGEAEEQPDANVDRKQQLMQELVGLKEEIGQLKAM